MGPGARGLQGLCRVLGGPGEPERPPALWGGVAARLGGQVPRPSPAGSEGLTLPPAWGSHPRRAPSTAGKRLFRGQDRVSAEEAAGPGSGHPRLAPAWCAERPQTQGLKITHDPRVLRLRSLVGITGERVGLGRAQLLLEAPGGPVVRLFRFLKTLRSRACGLTASFRPSPVASTFSPTSLTPALSPPHPLRTPEITLGPPSNPGPSPSPASPNPPCGVCARFCVLARGRLDSPVWTSVRPPGFEKGLHLPRRPGGGHEPSLGLGSHRPKPVGGPPTPGLCGERGSSWPGSSVARPLGP